MGDDPWFLLGSGSVSGDQEDELPIIDPEMELPLYLKLQEWQKKVQELELEEKFGRPEWLKSKKEKERSANRKLEMENLRRKIKEKLDDWNSYREQVVKKQEKEMKKQKRKLKSKFALPAGGKSPE